jgi:glucokinase
MSSAPGEVDSCLAVIALDVGGTSVKSALVARTDFQSFRNSGSLKPSGWEQRGLVNPGCSVLADTPLETPIDSEAEADSIIGVLARIIAVHLSHLRASRLLGVALGFPGPFDYTAGISYIAGVEKYAAIYGMDIGAALRRRLDLPGLELRFRNDAEAAILGEACYGAGLPYQRLIGVTLGTGCGSSFVSDGLPVTAGQDVPPGGWVYPLLFHGQRADDLFSRRGLEARLRQAQCFQGADNHDIDIKESASAARMGDASIQSIFESFGDDLGEFLAPLAVNFRAQALLILGQISGAFDLFGPLLQQAVDRSLQPFRADGSDGYIHNICNGPIRTQPLPALTGELGAKAALLGAADLYYQTLKDPKGFKNL